MFPCPVSVQKTLVSRAQTAFVSVTHKRPAFPALETISSTRTRQLFDFPKPEIVSLT